MAPIEAADGPPPPVARRRTHRKSRFGCSYCKGRRIKCDELRPACSNCVIRGLICSLGMAGTTPAPGPAASGPVDGSAPPPSVTVPAPPVFADALPPIRSPQRQPQQAMAGAGAPSFGLFPLGSLGTLALAASSPRAALGQPDGGPPSTGAPHPPNSAGLVGGGPPFHSPIDRRVSLASGTFSAGGFMGGGGGGGGGLDITDLELFHHFVTFTAVTFGHARTIQRFWAITAPQTGFSHPFVLHAILAVAGLHMVQLAADPARRQTLRRKVDEHWDVSLRLATPLLGDFNDGNSDALHVFTSLTCLYIFARGPQPGSFLLFDAEPPPLPSAPDVAVANIGGGGGGGIDGVHDSDGLVAAGGGGGGGTGSVSSHGDYGMTAAAAAAVAAAQGASSTEEWLVFFRGLRSVMKATKTAQRAQGGLRPREDKKSLGLIDQMFGPDATAEDMERDEHMLDSDDGDDEDMADAEEAANAKDPQQDGHSHSHGHGHHHNHHNHHGHHGHHGHHDGSPVNGGSSVGDLQYPSHPALRRKRPRRESSHLGSDNGSGSGSGGFAARSEPMRDLRDVIRQQVAAGDPDRDVYASAFAALATSFATVFDADMNPRHRSAQVVFGWMYHVSDDFVARARARRPVALAIFAHFVVLLRVLELGWMTRGWPEHLIAGIYDALSPAERLWIRWPMERVGWLPG